MEEKRYNTTTQKGELQSNYSSITELMPREMCTGIINQETLLHFTCPQPSAATPLIPNPGNGQVQPISRSYNLPIPIRTIVMLPFHLLLGPPHIRFQRGFSTKIPNSFVPILATCPAHHVLDFAIQTLLDDEYKQ
jgi:hypothetical protein